MNDGNAQERIGAPGGMLILVSAMSTVIVVAILAAITANDVKASMGLVSGLDVFTRVVGGVLVVLALGVLLESRNASSGTGPFGAAWLASILILSGTALLAWGSWTGLGAALAVGLAFVAAAMAQKRCACACCKPSGEGGPPPLPRS